MNMNMVALEREIERISEELRLSGEYTDSRLIDVRAEIDQIRLELHALRRFLQKAFPFFPQEFEKVKKEIVQEFDPEFQQERGTEK